MNRFSIISGLFFLLLAGHSCKREFSGARYDATDEIQIMDYIDSRDDLSTFKELVDYVGQRNLLKTAGNYTLFVPDNNAFAELFKTLTVNGKSITAISDVDADYWLDYFKYHFINEKINSNEFVFGPLPAPTAFNNKYLIADITDSYNAIYLNNTAKILESNIELSNGYVNVLDNVLTPPVNSVYETLKKSGKYETMLAIIDEAGYTSYLKDSMITLLVESDEALARSDFSKDSVPDLEDWVKYHIIADSAYFLNILAGKRFYPLYEKESLSFTVDAYGQYYVNGDYPFNQTKSLGIDKVCSNGIYHTLDTALQIVESLPSTIRFNFYPPGSSYGEQNVFTTAPATIVMNTGTQSYHQNKEYKIVAFNATQIGDYFWFTVPDVPIGKYQIRMIHRQAATRGKYLVIYNNTIVTESVNMAVKDGAFEEWDYLSYNYCGEITVAERSDVTLYFAFAGFGSNNSPSYCCDLLFDMLDLIPVND
ncbi:MAG: fasciclin domain-containing protein [Niabella sp.]